MLLWSKGNLSQSNTDTYTGPIEMEIIEYENDRKLLNVSFYQVLYNLEEEEKPIDVFEPLDVIVILKKKSTRAV